ncbi:AlpA family phage regulatory protein [Acinetobacter johnsonii]|uniref:AlpA family phage regulatory protein n=1 Tax=Acinetobacter johnsonii TaxID=40214 RepID=A0AA42LDH4_ACIJO|nr:AlpA family phage regulatory protein [Acinetobacter johnsonii]MDH0655064.1 AlpA family phage regulatory protein [Acinetobacter johnsonii]MDH0825216.1 AlpA family phage regulatory protein [Acinetobacter johnsonii]MDH1800502.1 AlpA family phage regulatory protein [Acinetobacter johnsonii]
MSIDNRVRASEFMSMLSVGRTKFYRMLKRGELPKPVKLSEKDVFWYESQVKKEVEKYKPESDNIACT